MPLTARPTSTRTTAALAAICSLLLLSSCTRTQETASAQSAAPSGRAGGGGRSGARGAAAVATATAVERAMPVTLRAVGNVEASSTVEVRAQVSGELTSVAFTEGQDVKAGDLLFTIDPRALDVALRQAEAVLARDTGQSKTAEAQRARYTSLLKAGLISQADFDSVSGQANSLLSAINADNAAIDNVKLQLTYTKIHAPVSGKTGALLVHKGSLVRANDTSPLVVINQIAPVNVTFAVPAKRLMEIRSEQARGRLRVQAIPAGSDDPPSTGAVNFIDNAVDQATDTIRLKGTFANADRKLWPGQFVEVTLQLAIDPHAIVIPSAAIQPGQQGSFVFVVTSNKTVEVRTVTIARTDGHDSVIASGLQAGETVVTDGQLGLVPGASVNPKTATPAAR
jgi:membrane fusion protein, multidrug efflux system